MAHAALLLASDNEDLKARQRQRELPTNPPQVETKRSKTDRHFYSYQPWKFYGPNRDIKLYSLHNAALFACTRWTNLYFPASAGFFGDIVGGPLQPWFGPGIRDIAVTSGRFLGDHILSAHLAYWKKSTGPSRKVSKALTSSLPAIIEALDLDNLDYYNNVGKNIGKQKTGRTARRSTGSNKSEDPS